MGCGRGAMTDQYDVGQATMAMMIAATDLGIGTGNSSVGDQDKARAIPQTGPTTVRRGCAPRALVIRSRYAKHVDRKTPGVHVGQAGEPMQKPSSFT
jgi:hypothetical protein